MEHRIFVVATTLAETRHALDVAQPLATRAGSRLAVVVPVVNHATVSSARANVHDLDVAALDALDPQMSASRLRTLFSTLLLEPEVIVVSALTAARIAAIVPAGSTVIVCGPLHRFFETRQQRIARDLARRLQDVVFLPHPDAALAVEHPPGTEAMPHLVC